MKTISLLSAAALIAIANPAHAQLLGGVLGGGGGAGGAVGGLPSIPRVDTSTIGSATGSGRATATPQVDRRSGKASASTSASAQGSGSASQTTSTPLGNLTGAGQGSAQGSGSANADAQLIGTDAVRGTTRSVRNAAGETVGNVRNTAGSTVQGARDRVGNTVNGAGTVTGNLVGSANGTLNAGTTNLALAGSAAGDATGAFEVKRGMKLFDADGERIGQVRQVIADARGQVQALVVKVDDTVATLPATAFTTDGSALVSLAGEGQIKAIGEQQANEPAPAPAGN